MKNRNKERIIFDSRYDDDYFAETREALAETYDYVTDQMVCDVIADQMQDLYNEVLDNLSALFRGDTVIAMGACGTWRGRLAAGTVEEDFDLMFSRMRRNWEDVKIYDVNGHLYVEGVCHDGTDFFEIKKLTTRGVALYEKWEESDASDTRTLAQIHSILFRSNLFTELGTPALFRR